MNQGFPYNLAGGHGVLRWWRRPWLAARSAVGWRDGTTARASGAVVMLKMCARADRQHAQVLAGDEHGVYGDYAPDALG